jgi:hypothetical protein
MVARGHGETPMSYRGEVIGQLAKLTVVESDKGRAFELRPWKPFILPTVASRTAETPAPVQSGISTQEGGF